MPALSHHITYRSSSLHYLRSGHGPEWLFCFHGYGESAQSFSVLEPLLGEHFTIIALDLPFHGKTEWREGLLFTPEDLVAIISLIKPGQEPLHLLGFSMGGRVALQLIQAIPSQIKKAVLVAPDGLHTNKWQWVATRTYIGNRIFHYTMLHPGWLMGWIDLGAGLGLYEKSLHKFIHHYLDNKAERLVLYRRWTTMRLFRPIPGLLRRVIMANKIPVHLLFGKHDPVILSKHGKRFSKHAAGYISVTEIEAGHQLLKEKYAPAIAGLLSEIGNKKP